MNINYEFLKNAYTGLGGFLDGSYVEPFPRETTQRIEKRRKLAVNLNITKKVVNTITGHLFRKPPIRKIISKAYQRFMENTDMQGTYIDTLMKRIFRLGLIYGTVFVIVDRPSKDVSTELEKQELGVFPYVVIRLPTHLVHYELDEYDRLSKIVFKEPTPDGLSTIYRIFTKNKWIVSRDIQGNNPIRNGEHNLGEVPVITYSPVPPELPGQILSTPFILEIAQIQKAIYNLLSELHSVLRDTSFPIFTFPVGSQSDLEKLEKEPIVIGTENAIAYTPQGSARPDFIAPPPEPAQQILENIKFLIEQAMELANLNFKGGVQKSGIAKEYDYMEFTKMLSDFSQGLEELEYKIAKLVCTWEDEEFQGWIEYPKEFTPYDVEKQTKVLMEVINNPEIPQEIRNEAMKKLHRLILGDTLDEQRLNELDRVIDAKDDFEEKMRQEGLL
ncbi:MAG: hypothetical protein DSY32_03175 [Aquifex sp.]|nr:MAG: hypothetical protein DSY32_03175 [Aquifex sp.]